MSWMQIIIIGVAYIASLGVFYGTMQAGYNALHGAVDEMKNEIHDQTIALNRLAGANERLDEHMKSVDRRLDILEKDKPIESYRRN